MFESPYCIKKPPIWMAFYAGGPEEIRTPDPHNANVMRSQLRYRPLSTIEIIVSIARFVKCFVTQKESFY